MLFIFIVFGHKLTPYDEYFSFSALNKGRYSSTGLKMNSKVFRFDLGTYLYNVKLSKMQIFNYYL
jgi:hypothetical protein